MFTYYGAASQDRISVVQAQRSLQSLYGAIMVLLGIMIALIAPALTATAVVAERQRKSLDLVFSAPVSPKYYLVGKLISSYRYVWMLLVLSLPVTAACVVLGGASWSEVLVSYLLMSIHGLIYSTIGLLFSTLARKPMGAIVWSYLTVFCVYWPLSAALGAMPDAMLMGPRGASINELPFVVCLNPFTIQNSAPTYTVISGYHVPNWLLTAGVVLLFSKIMLLGAASVLSSYGSAETKSLRIHGLIYASIASFGMAVSLGSALSMVGSFTTSATAGTPSAPSFSPELQFSRAFVLLLSTLAVVLPFITCYGTDLEKKFWPDGLFDLRRVFMATPSGGLPYIFALSLSVAGGMACYRLINAAFVGSIFLEYVFYGIALAFFCWSLGRLTSSLNNGLRYARTLQLTLIIFVFVLPIPFLYIADPFGAGSTEFSIWDLYLLRPVFSSNDRSTHAAVLGIVFLVVGLVVAKWSEAIAKRKYRRAGLSYDGT